MWPPLFRWFFFTILPAMTPFLWLVTKLWRRHEVISLADLFGRGELLLASSAFAAVGIGDLIGTSKKHRVKKYVASGCCLLVLSLAINDYGDVGLLINQGQWYDHFRVAMESLIMGSLSLIAGGACIILAQLK
jgi:hypothetical protein